MRLKLILAILLIFIVGCAQETTPQPTAPTVTQDAPTEPVADTTPQPAPDTTDETTTVDTQDTAQPEPKKELTQEVIDLLAVYNTKTKSLYYLYKKSGSGEKHHNVYVKGDKVKINYPDLLKLNNDIFDTVYFDTKAKTAVAYCDDKSDCKKKGKIGDVDYNTYYLKTPIDWINDITYAEKGMSRQIESRDVTALVSNSGTLWVNPFYGVPLEIEVNGEVISFQDMQFNGVKDTDVNPQ